jgi:phosphoribosyl-dephospho-CoA transferase
MRRHDLVYLPASASFSTPCAAPGSPPWQAAAAWIAGGLPLVAARQSAGGQRVRLGLCLLQHLDRQRLSIEVDAAQIAGIQPALAVERCLGSLPEATADVLLGLAATIKASGARLGVYGSLAWESLSGETYRHAGSDIDLICDVASPEQYDIALTALAHAASRLPCRLDGELRRPDGLAVAWPELAARRSAVERTVLVKGEQEVVLLPLGRWLSGLRPAALAA